MTDSPSPNGKSAPGTDSGSKSAPPQPEFLPELVNCKVEEEALVADFASRRGIALIAIIAPYVSVRISLTIALNGTPRTVRQRFRHWLASVIEPF